MPIATPNELTSETSIGGGTSYTTQTIAPAANALILVIVSILDNNDGCTDITITDSFSGGIGSWTDDLELPHSDGVSFLSFSWALTNSSPGTGTITATSDVINQSDWRVGVYEIASGYNSSAPIAQSTIEEETRATTVAITLPSAVTSGNAVIGFLYLRDEDAGVTPGTDFTELADFGTGEGANTGWMHVEYDLTPADGTADWSDIDSNGKATLDGVVEIAAEAGGRVPPNSSLLITKRHLLTPRSRL